MHGELMELNRRLQISLLAKEEAVKHLQEELILLRGPLPSDEVALHKLVNLWVPSVFLTGRYSDPHHVYQVCEIEIWLELKFWSETIFQKIWKIFQGS